MTTEQVTQLPNLHAYKEGFGPFWRMSMLGKSHLDQEPAGIAVCLKSRVFLIFERFKKEEEKNEST